MSDIPGNPFSAADPSRDIWQQALEWQVTFWSGEVTPADEENFHNWWTANPEHERAWQKAQRLDQRLHAAPVEVAGKTLREPGLSTTRRTVLRSLTVAATGVAAAYLARETPQWKQAAADFRTGIGERRDIVLSDGTQITLNTASALDAALNSSERNLVLHRGEVLITTASDPRPFTVFTAHGSVRALGTRFTVRQAEGVSRVAVFEGAVEIRPHGDAGAAIRLNAGQQVRFDSGVVAVPEAADVVEAAWTRGLLVAERMRLGDFMDELGRYRSGVVRCDPAVAGLIVSGVYPLSDTNRVLESIAQALPVRVSYATRYWVTVGPR